MKWQWGDSMKMTCLQLLRRSKCLNRGVGPVAGVVRGLCRSSVAEGNRAHPLPHDDRSKVRASLTAREMRSFLNLESMDSMTRKIHVVLGCCR